MTWPATISLVRPVSSVTSAGIGTAGWRNAENSSVTSKILQSDANENLKNVLRLPLRFQDVRGAVLDLAVGDWRESRVVSPVAIEQLHVPRNRSACPVYDQNAKA